MLDLYSFIKPVLFKLDPERAHKIACSALQVSSELSLNRPLFGARVEQPIALMGLRFPNRVGLAAGFDKNGDYYQALSELGFGYVEVGTVTPKPQAGNIKPRLFRLVEASALINRMGFNNKGVDYALKQLEKRNWNEIIGVNIGKNRDTSIEKAVDDYVYCFRTIAPVADYITVNVSSPNTANLRELHKSNYLGPLLESLLRVRSDMNIGRHIPLLIKVSPDMTSEQLQDFITTIKQSDVDGIIGTNTSINRDSVSHLRFGNEQGGLSGSPLLSPALQLIKTLREELGPDFPLIGVGGIMHVDDAQKFFTAGANLVQIYSGFVYKGPHLIKEIAESQISDPYC